MRNRRRGTATRGVLRTWLMHHREALVILTAMLLAGVAIGTGMTLLLSEPATEQLLFPKEPEQVPHVVTTFKCWTESPKGNSILMVWSDGQVWRARTDNGTTISQFEFLVHVRLGETP